MQLFLGFEIVQMMLLFVAMSMDMSSVVFRENKIFWSIPHRFLSSKLFLTIYGTELESFLFWLVLKYFAVFLQVQDRISFLIVGRIFNVNNIAFDFNIHIWSIMTFEA